MAHVVVGLPRLVVEVVHLRVIRGRRLVVVRVLVVLIVPEVVRLVVRHVAQRVVGGLRGDWWRRRRHDGRVGAQWRQVPCCPTACRSGLSQARIQVRRVRVQVTVVTHAEGTHEAVLAAVLTQALLLLVLQLLLLVLVQRGRFDVALGESGCTAVQTGVVLVALTARGRVVEGGGS